jgi:hypothetical protein
MISSEVQRTLVKSPPELWAELSDPKSLARHLGELGEIRITKAEPEELVEWEAEEARGSVAIKASGWGTKVTLRASREYTPAEPEEAQLESVEPETTELEDPHAEPAEAMAPATEDAPEAAPQASELREGLSEPAAEPVADKPDEAWPASSGLDAWSRQEAELTVTAAERFGHEHSATLLGSDLQLAADRELEAPAPQAESGTEQPQASRPVPEAEAPAPRIGFFARLFGRGRKNRAGSPAPTVEPGPTHQAALASGLASGADPAQVEEPPTAEVPAAIDEPLGEVESAPVEESQLESEPEPEPAPTAEAQISEPEGLPEQPTDGEVASAPEPRGAAVDLAAELKAAEEEVKTILTGVLDRLGAAHHRPVSRA